MEKIQQAIAKARSQREAQIAAAPAAPAAPAPTVDAAAPASAPAPEPTTAEVAAARWRAMPQFTPKSAVLRRNRIVAAAGGAGSSGFDSIRTRILQLQRAHGWRRIAVTSPDPRCGKSTVTLNLAWSLARQSEQRTIVMETDLRRPTLARMLGHTAKHDFAAVLEGKAGFEDNGFRIGENLIVATSNRVPPNPAEILHGAAAKAALDEIAADYQPTVMLFDLPPMLATDDALAFLPLVDAAILVAAAEQTTVGQIDLCEREIAAVTNVMGVVLNKCRYMDREQSYDYGY